MSLDPNINHALQSSEPLESLRQFVQRLQNDGNSEAQVLEFLEQVRKQLRIVERAPIQVPPNERNKEYLRVKREKLGHLLDEVE